MATLLRGTLGTMSTLHGKLEYTNDAVSKEASAEVADLEKKLAVSEAKSEDLQYRLSELQAHNSQPKPDSMDTENYKRKVAALEQQIAHQELLQQRREAELRGQLAAHKEAESSKIDDQEEMKKRVEHHKASEEHLRKVIAIQEMELREIKQSQQSRRGLRSTAEPAPGLADMLCGSARGGKEGESSYRGSLAPSSGRGRAETPPGYAPARVMTPPGYAPALASSYRVAENRSQSNSEASSLHSLPRYGNPQSRGPNHQEHSV